MCGFRVDKVFVFVKPRVAACKRRRCDKYIEIRMYLVDIAHQYLGYLVFCKPTLAFLPVVIDYEINKPDNNVDHLQYYMLF